MFKSWKLWSFLIVILVGATGFLWIHGKGLWTCGVNGYDLGRDTSYSFISGNCFVVQKDGSKIDVKRLIGDGGGSEDDVGDVLGTN